MYNELIEKMSGAAEKKLSLFQESKLKYIISSMNAGMYVGVAVLLIMTIGGSFAVAHSPATKLVMGLSFSVALSLVIITGTDLFTGNNLVLTVSTLHKRTSIWSLLNIWTYSYVGNFLGSIGLAIVFIGTGFVDQGTTRDFFEYTALAKTSATPLMLFSRGVLCNVLVCLATLSTYRTNDDTAKLIMVFWCIFAFITTGFEHCVANMTLFSVVLLSDSITTLSLSAAMNNLLYVTLGNIVGGAIIVGGATYMLKSKV